MELVWYSVSSIYLWVILNCLFFHRQGQLFAHEEHGSGMRLTILDLVLPYNLVLDNTFKKKEGIPLEIFKCKSNPSQIDFIDPA